MNTFDSIIDLCPVPFQHAHVMQNEDGIDISLEINLDKQDLEHDGGHDHQLKMSALIDALVDQACSIIHPQTLRKVSIEVVYMQGHFVDAIGEIIAVTWDADSQLIKVERYDPWAMQTESKYRTSHIHMDPLSYLMSDMNLV